MSGEVIKVSGPLVAAVGLLDASVAEVVRVGEQRLLGEILSMSGGRATIQMYEETSGLCPGAAVEATGAPLYVELGPGMLGGIYDGLRRPLTEVREITGHSVARGIDVPALNRTRLWEFEAAVAVGDKVVPGDIIGTVRETGAIVHRIMVPFGAGGEVVSVQGGSFTVTDTVCLVRGDGGENHKLTLMQKWPVRKSRPFNKKILPSEPLTSGQRVIDTLFPMAKGGTAAIPGPSGSGKTVMQRQLAKWSDVDIVVYVCCGGRGSEMADQLRELSSQKDERFGEPLQMRTILVANTSESPIMAHESSVYTGASIAEYYRDMGYDVALIADSTTAWAEALREMSGLLGEMPGDEGYPVYLNSRLAQFYERAGVVECLGSDERRGSLTLIGAVSPPGGDISEPVTQATMRIVKAFWALDGDMANERRFPAVSLTNSYSLYYDNLKAWLSERYGPQFLENRERALGILSEEEDILETKALMGHDSLSPENRLTLASAKLIREEFLRQNAFDETDGYSSYERQAMLLHIFVEYDRLCGEALSGGAELEKLETIPALASAGGLKSIPSDEYQKRFKDLFEKMKRQIEQLVSGDDEHD